MIEELRYLLRREAPIFFAQILDLGEAEETELLAKVKRLPEGGELIVQVAYSVGQEKPNVGDIGVIVIAADESDYAVMIAYMPNQGRPLHPRVEDSDVVIGARPGKKTNICSDTRINIGQGGDEEEDEPLVLGGILSEYLTTLVADIASLITQVSTVTAQLSALAGIVAAIPGGSGASAVTTALVPVSTALTNLNTKIGTTDKQTYLVSDASNIVSQIAFTERG